MAAALVTQLYQSQKNPFPGTMLATLVPVTEHKYTDKDNK
jgi:hypothetical protein